jgi:outer membrane protein assembly factor BamB
MSSRMLNTMIIRSLLGICTTLWLTDVVLCEGWPQFRGPNQDGVVSDANLPIEWGPKNQVLWKVDLPGTGWSQPIVWGERIIVTTAETDEQTKPDPKFTTPNIGEKANVDVNYRWKVLCLDAANGKTVWQRTAREGKPTIPTHINNTYASETPVTDGQRLIAYFGMAGVYCYDLAGNPLWTRDLGAHSMMFGWGTGSSPILLGDKVFVQCDNEESSFLVALDKKRGHDVWRVERNEKTNWSTPYVWKNKLRTELVTAGGGQMRSYDPASGKLLWFMNGSGRTATSPTGDAELLYVDSYDRFAGSIGVLAAIRPGASGDISLNGFETTNPQVAWSSTIKAFRASTPTLCRDCLYIPEQFAGVIRCLDAKTGKEHYRKRLPGAAAGFTASALVNGDKIYLTDQRGHTHIIEAGPELKVVAVNKLNEEMCWSSPAVVGNRILIRTTDHLFAIGEK